MSIDIDCWGVPKLKVVGYIEYWSRDDFLKLSANSDKGIYKNNNKVGNMIIKTVTYF